MKCPPCNNNCNQGRDCPTRVCVGKHKYPTQDIAEVLISKKQGAKSVAYKCPVCSYFHIKDADTTRNNFVRSPK